MKQVKPEVFLVSRPNLDHLRLADYLRDIDGSAWLRRMDEHIPEGEQLIEAAGRLCYRSWEPGLNPNVTKIREDHEKYLANILGSAHGSVLEHAAYGFIFHNVSRVFTHELVRHRAGTAISQESMRYVRLDNLPFWFPDWAQQDEELMAAAADLLREMEAFQHWMARHFEIDSKSFAEKKRLTSFMRRFVPHGVSTGVLWTANVRTLRHVIEARTAEGAEEEMRLVFGQVGQLMLAELPDLFGDYVVEDGAWRSRWNWKKV